MWRRGGEEGKINNLSFWVFTSLSSNRKPLFFNHYCYPFALWTFSSSLLDLNHYYYSFALWTFSTSVSYYLEVLDHLKETS